MAFPLLLLTQAAALAPHCPSVGKASLHPSLHPSVRVSVCLSGRRGSAVLSPAGGTRWAQPWRWGRAPGGGRPPHCGASLSRRHRRDPVGACRRRGHPGGAHRLLLGHEQAGAALRVGRSGAAAGAGGAGQSWNGGTCTCREWAPGSPCLGCFPQGMVPPKPLCPAGSPGSCACPALGAPARAGAGRGPGVQSAAPAHPLPSPARRSSAPTASSRSASRRTATTPTRRCAGGTGAAPCSSRSIARAGRSEGARRAGSTSPPTSSPCSSAEPGSQTVLWKKREK